MPIRVQDSVYYVEGCFCSYNCTIAHIIDENRDVWGRLQLLKQMSKYISDVILDIYANIAPSWKLLKPYGGVLAIEEFRKGFIKFSNTNIIQYPIKYQETNVEIFNNMKLSSRNLPVDTTNKKVVIKRKDKEDTKVLKKGNLESMGIIVEN